MFCIHMPSPSILIVPFVLYVCCSLHILTTTTIYRAKHVLFLRHMDVWTCAVAIRTFCDSFTSTELRSEQNRLKSHVTAVWVTYGMPDQYQPGPVRGGNTKIKRKKQTNRAGFTPSASELDCWYRSQPRRRRLLAEIRIGSGDLVLFLPPSLLLWTVSFHQRCCHLLDRGGSAGRDVCSSFQPDVPTETSRVFQLLSASTSSNNSFSILIALLKKKKKGKCALRRLALLF